MKYVTILIAGVLFSVSTPTTATDIKRGETLHTANCVGCHNQDVYTRENRRIKSLDSLRSQVVRCEANLDLKLFPEDMDAITDYLNTNYYQFK